MVENFEAACANITGGFGTENVALLLSALVRFTRPRSVFEVGAGLTTLHLLRALKDNVEDDKQERSGSKNIYGKTDYYNTPYVPRLLTVDDSSHRKSFATKVRRIASELRLEEFLQIENVDFRGFSRNIPRAILPLDLVWFDCGGLQEYIDFIDEYWPLVNAAGGMIVLHSTLTNLQLRLFLQQIIERHVSSRGRDFELISLLEPHKKLQNSVSIIRMTSEMRTPLYTFEP